MKQTVVFTLLAAAGALTVPLAFAQEVGRVISSTPVISQIPVPRQVCSQQQVQVQGQKSGGGALLGAVAGGAIGNQFGGGEGRAIATLIGLVGGAMVGDRVEGGGQSQTQNVQSCTTQTYYENRTTAYNVVYEFNGKQYSVQMPQDPGPSVRLQVSPVGAAVPAPQSNYTEVQPEAAPVYAQPPVVYIRPPVVYTQPQVVTQVVQPVYPIAYPIAYPRAYYPPVGVSLNLGWSNWNGHHGHGHGHRNWR